jgi:hypothetical protein
VTLGLSLREEYRVGVFENRVLRKDITGEWRKLHNEELCNLLSLPNIIQVIKPRRMRWAEHVARMGRRICAHGVLVGRPEEKKPFERHRRRCENNIKMVLQEMGRGGMDRIDVAEGKDRWWAPVQAVMKRWVP